MDRDSPGPPGRVIQLIANPAAGGHSPRRVSALRSALERAGAEVILSECGPHRPLQLDARAHHLCIVGGDGSVRLAALAAQRCGRELTFSLYPAGTVNLLHRENRCQLKPEHYAASILHVEKARHHYAASLNDSLFLACASVGPDSAAVAALSPWLKRWIGRLAYAVAFGAVLLRWPRPSIRLHSNGRSIECEAFYVAKGRYFAGPWSFAPEARVGEPLLHVVALERARRRDYFRFLLRMLTKSPIGTLPGAVCFTCTELRAECGEPCAVQADGDIAAALPVTIAVAETPFVFH